MSLTQSRNLSEELRYGRFNINRSYGMPLNRGRGGVSNPTQVFRDTAKFERKKKELEKKLRLPGPVDNPLPIQKGSIDFYSEFDEPSRLVQQQKPVAPKPVVAPETPATVVTGVFQETGGQVRDPDPQITDILVQDEPEFTESFYKLFGMGGREIYQDPFFPSVALGGREASQRDQKRTDQLLNGETSTKGMLQNSGSTTGAPTLIHQGTQTEFNPIEPQRPRDATIDNRDGSAENERQNNFFQRHFDESKARQERMSEEQRSQGAILQENARSIGQLRNELRSNRMTLDDNDSNKNLLNKRVIPYKNFKYPSTRKSYNNVELVRMANANADYQENIFNTRF